MTAASAFPQTADPGVIGMVVGLYLLVLGAGTFTAFLMASSVIRRPVDWRERATRLLARPVSWRDASFLLGAFLALMLGALFTIWLLGRPSQVTQLVLQSVMVHVAGLTLTGVYLRVRGTAWRDMFGLGWQSFHGALRIGLLMYLAMLPLVFFSSFVYQGILTAKGYPPSLQEVALLLTGTHPWWMRLYMLLMAVVLAPVFEETLFRGLLLPLLGRRLGIGAGIFVSSLVFASIHLHLPSLIPLTVVAVGFSIGYLYSGTLWVPITMHALFNAVNLVLLFLIRA